MSDDPREIGAPHYMLPGNKKNKDIYVYLFNLQEEDKMKFSSIEKPVNMSSSKHIGYAIQWFGLCLALIILTIYAYRRKDG